MTLAVSRRLPTTIPAVAPWDKEGESGELADVVQWSFQVSVQFAYGNAFGGPVKSISVAWDAVFGPGACARYHLVGAVLQSTPTKAACRKARPREYFIPVLAD